MNYRLLLSEMLFDYRERRQKEIDPERIAVYTEVIKDLIIALDIEPSVISNINCAKKIIKG